MSESRKRRGDEEHIEIPPKRAHTDVGDAGDIRHDVVLIVDGHKFYCMKEDLALHSDYFFKMFNMDLMEKNKTEMKVEGPFDSVTFRLFLDVIEGKASITDEQVEKLLEVSDFLQSTTLEKNVMDFLAQSSKITPKEQFMMAETHHAYNLMAQIFSSVKDQYKLGEIVPSDFDSFCNTTKNIILKRSFELHGILKPPPPRIPEKPDEAFEAQMNELLDQVEVQNHHGNILSDQAYIIFQETYIEHRLHFVKPEARVQINQSPQIAHIMEQLESTHCPVRRNSYRAQIAILTIKLIHVYGEVPWPYLEVMVYRYAIIIKRDKRHLEEARRNILINHRIDEIYETIANGNGTKYSFIKKSQPEWVEWITQFRYAAFRATFRMEKLQIELDPIPDGVRDIPWSSYFHDISSFVEKTRTFHYNLDKLVVPLPRRVQGTQGNGENHGPPEPQVPVEVRPEEDQQRQNEPMGEFIDGLSE